MVIKFKSVKLQCGSKQNISWPKIKEFDQHVGKKKIEKYIKTWNINDEWIYYLPKPFKIEKRCCDYYIFTVRWSQPTPACPIAQATADVYFYIKVCRVFDPETPVEVVFQLENSKELYEPGKFEMKKKLLLNIINNKIEFYKKLRF
uniref:Uncharacterized protein n=1 Tax=Clastoptera arizonana TaxID=38151 RepID=A0A1B6CM04_9HEMI